MPAFTLARGWSQPKPPSMADRLWCCVTVGHDTAVETKQPEPLPTARGIAAHRLQWK